MVLVATSDRTQGDAKNILASTVAPQQRMYEMRIVVIGGRGCIGAKLVSVLRANGHEVIAASPSSGVDAYTGKGLANALAGAQVLVDVAESPRFEDRAVMDFFVTSSRHLLAAEATAGISHHVALSVVGVDHIKDSGYFRAKAAQEDLIRTSPIAYTIVRSTLFFDFMEKIMQAGTDCAACTLRVAAIYLFINADHGRRHRDGWRTCTAVWRRLPFHPIDWESAAA